MYSYNYKQCTIFVSHTHISVDDEDHLMGATGGGVVPSEGPSTLDSNTCSTDGLVTSTDNQNNSLPTASATYCQPERDNEVNQGRYKCMHIIYYNMHHFL